MQTTIDDVVSWVNLNNSKDNKLIIQLFLSSC